MPQEPVNLLHDAAGRLEALIHECRDLRRDLAAMRALAESRYLEITYPDRAKLPPPGRQPAIVVRLDYDGIVPFRKSREPFAAVEERFARERLLHELLCPVLQPFFNIPDVPDHPTDDPTEPCWHNPYFGPMDARILYSVVRHFKPRRFVEVGSGFSTRFLRRAIRDGEMNTTVTSIDPYPRSEIGALVDRVIESSVADCPLELFAGLEPGDVFFLDGSHLCFHGTDVTHVLLRVLPVLPPGVLVQIHDIYLPEEYPEAIDCLYYNEQYLLAAFLLGNDQWEVTLPVHYLYRQNLLPGDGVSLWMRKRT